MARPVWSDHSAPFAAQLCYATPWSSTNQTKGGYSFKIDPDRVQDWVRYVGHVVEFLVRPPYSVQFFQVWNENWGWSKSTSDYMKMVHIPAARRIRELGGKVVYGGWPSDGSLFGLFDSLDRAPEAWNLTDVLDCHYQTGWSSAWAYDAMYTEAQKRGVEPMGLWQTEVGNSEDPTFFASRYPKVLYWWATHAPHNPDFAKIFYFMENYDDGDPADPYFNTTLFRHCASGSCSSTVGENCSCSITERGLGLQAVASVFDGDAVTNYSRFTATLNNTLVLTDDTTTFSLAQWCPQVAGWAAHGWTVCPKHPPSVAQGFLVHSVAPVLPPRLVIAVQLVSFDLADPDGRGAFVNVSVQLPKGLQPQIGDTAPAPRSCSVERVDVAGHSVDITDRARWIDTPNGEELVVSVHVELSEASPAAAWGLSTVAPFFLVLRWGAFE